MCGKRFSSVAAMATGAFLLLSAVFGSPAWAHEVRFIASDGDDTDDCTRAAPCRTLERGVESTPEGGELIVLDSGDFESSRGVVINHSMTVSAVGVSATLGNWILIDGPVGTIVVLRGLRLDGGGISQTGIRIAASATAHIEDCEIQN